MDAHMGGWICMGNRWGPQPHLRTRRFDVGHDKEYSWEKRPSFFSRTGLFPWETHENHQFRSGSDRGTLQAAILGHFNPS